MPDPGQRSPDVAAFPVRAPGSAFVVSVDSLTREARDAFAGYAEPHERPPFRTYAALAAVFNAGFAGALVAAKRSDRLPESVSAQDVVLIGTASHKLSRLIAKDKVTASCAPRSPSTRAAAALPRSRSEPAAKASAGPWASC